MKILFVGQVSEGQTSRMRMRALERLGHTLRSVNTMEPWRQASWLKRQTQRRLQSGPIVNAINRAILAAAREERPHIVWAEKQEYLSAETVVALRKLGAKTVHFTPDPYFTLPWKRTTLMDRAMREFDALVYCKAYERGDYEALGRPLIYMPLGYCDENHRPMRPTDSRWNCVVGFVGGWEPHRERLLSAVGSTGVRMKIWGANWDFLHDGRWTLRRHVILRQLAGGDRFTFHCDPVLVRAHQGGEVYGDDYARVLSATKIGLGFLRKVCPDQHTTRTFEIPACGSLLLADRTVEHRGFFKEGYEADFFSSQEELLDKIAFYDQNEAVRTRIAKAGFERCVTGKYSYVHRLSAVLEELAISWA